MQLLIQGMILGFIIVLPGMSGGTLLLIFGLYEKLLSDLSRLKLLPYLPFAAGAALGVFASGFAFTALFETHRDLTVAFLMGGVLASVRPVLGPRPKVSGKLLLIALIGFGAGLLLASEPLGGVRVGPEPGLVRLAIGGALASVAMLIPGVPGSTVLILFGIYDDVLRYLAEVSLIPLLVFLFGSLAGIFMLATAVDRFYSRYQTTIAWLFSGLIVGSARTLLPTAVTLPVIMLFALGFALVWGWDIWRERRQLPV